METICLSMCDQEAEVIEGVVRVGKLWLDLFYLISL